MSGEAVKKVGGPVVHPVHYNACGEVGEDGSVKFEPIKVIEAWGYSEGFCLGNALKYILRASHKGSEREDLEKAVWYLERASNTRSSLWRSIFGIAKRASVMFSVFRSLFRRPISSCSPRNVAISWGLSRDLQVAVELILSGANETAAAAVRLHLEAMRHG